MGSNITYKTIKQRKQIASGISQESQKMRNGNEIWNGEQSYRY